jgi:hypothetical protein
VVVPFDPLQINTIQEVRYKAVNENGEMSGVVLEQISKTKEQSSKVI